MVVADKLVEFVAFMHRKGAKKMHVDYLKRVLAKYYGVKPETAASYVKDLVRFDFMEHEGNMFKLKKRNGD